MDLAARDEVYGEPYQLLQGNATRTRPIRHNRIIKIPRIIADKYYNVEIFMDIFFVNKIPFFHTKSESINFWTLQPIETQRKRDITKGIEYVQNNYIEICFNVMRWHEDNEFDILEIKKRYITSSVGTICSGGTCWFCQMIYTRSQGARLINMRRTTI